MGLFSGSILFVLHHLGTLNRANSFFIQLVDWSLLQRFDLDPIIVSCFLFHPKNPKNSDSEEFEKISQKSSESQENLKNPGNFQRFMKISPNAQKSLKSQGITKN